MKKLISGSDRFNQYDILKCVLYHDIIYEIYKFTAIYFVKEISKFLIMYIILNLNTN